MTTAVTPDEFQCMPMSAPRAWNQFGSDMPWSAPLIAVVVNDRLDDGIADPTIRSVKNPGTAPKWSGIPIAPELIMLCSPVSLLCHCYRAVERSSRNLGTTNPLMLGAHHEKRG